MAWGVRPLRPDQGVRRRAGRDHGARGDPRHPLLLPRRQADHDPAVGPLDPGDFLATAVTELDGTSEVATYGPPYNDTPGVGQKVLGVPTQRWPGVHYRIDTATDFVLDPLRSIPGNASLRRALAAYRGRAAGPAIPLDRRVYGGPEARPLSGGTSQAAPWSLRSSRPDDELSGRPRPERRARRRPPDVEPVLPDELHQAAPVPLRGRLLRIPRRGTAPARHPMGNDERDGKLSRPGLALALHLLVPDRAFQHLGERRRADLRPDDGAQSRVHLHPVHPGPAEPAAAPRRSTG